ncbi:MAG: ROK family protein [Lachnospiraceae bacterium]|nr:ROK family protein [Lachnospiraceae bacterium]
MKNSADIRKRNKDLIRRHLWTGEKNTKQGIAEVTGLSVATCNTMLNEMEADGEIYGVKKQLNGIGRSTMVYSVNEGHESIVCVHVAKVQELYRCSFSVLSVTGRIKDERTDEYKELTKEIFDSFLEEVVNRYQNVSYIIIGLPAIINEGVVTQCEVACLEDIALKEELEKKYQCCVHIESDMHLTAYGYFRSNDDPDDVITLVSFIEGYKPSMVTIYEGIIIKGANAIAGASGFMPFGYSINDIAEIITDKEKRMNIIKYSLICCIALMNPRKILMFTDLVDAEEEKEIIENIKEVIPEEFIPEFDYTKCISKYFQCGLYHRALDLKLR